MYKTPDPIMRYLTSYEEGDPQALHRLLPLVYATLKQMAKNQLKRSGMNQTLGATGLVNEAYLRLFDKKKISIQDRPHFFKLAACCMRSILADSVRSKRGKKRGGQAVKVIFNEGLYKAEEVVSDEALHRVLNELFRINRRLGQLVELRFLVGLNIEETATALNLSPATVKRDWQLAKAWLYRELSRPEWTL